MESACISLFMKPLITPLSCVIVLNQLKCLPQIPFWGYFGKRMTTHPFMLWLSRRHLIRSSLFCGSMASSRRWNPCHTCHLIWGQPLNPSELWLHKAVMNLSPPVGLSHFTGMQTLSFLSFSALVSYKHFHTETIPCTYAQYFSIVRNLNSRKPVSLSLFRAHASKVLTIIGKL